MFPQHPGYAKRRNTGNHNLNEKYYNTREKVGRCRLSCLLHYIMLYLSIPLHTHI